MSTATIRYSEAIEKAKAARIEAQSLAKEALIEGANTLFDTHPKLKAFRWTQYTPHFNDGEECVFGVNDPACLFDGATQDDDEDGFEDWTQDASKSKVLKACAKLVNSFDDDSVLKAVFGDHCQVTATRGQFEVEEYEHH